MKTEGWCSKVLFDRIGFDDSDEFQSPPIRRKKDDWFYKEITTLVSYRGCERSKNKNRNN